MSVLLETTIGDLVVDLDYKTCSAESYNFLKLCKTRFYDCQCIYDLHPEGSARLGDPQVGFAFRTDLPVHNTSIEGLRDTRAVTPKLIEASVAAQPAERFGQVAFVLKPGTRLLGSNILLALNPEPRPHINTVRFAQVIDESLAVLQQLSDVPRDLHHLPRTDIRIRRAHILYDPFPDNRPLPVFLPPVTAARVRLPSADKGSPETLTGAKELTLEILGDIRRAGIAPAENVLFVCKLNPLTRAADLATVFAQFGHVNSVEVIRDRDSGRSLGYGFVEFATKAACELAYTKMDGALIDDRRVHVDFSQSLK
ncbi:FAFR649Wp [Eremothecium gossypii FDAG1]|nr:FAFR649Wp [Eremothecium gossypii FDAG1]